MSATAPRPNPLHEAEPFEFPFAHPALTSTTTTVFWKARADYRIDSVEYVNQTGLAEDATNVFKGEIKRGSTILFTLFNTDSDGAGDNNLTAATFVAATPNEDPEELVGEKDDVLSLVMTEGGTATLPAGHFIMRGFYI